MLREEMLARLRKSIVAGDVENARKVAEEAARSGFHSDAAVEEMYEAMKIAGRKFEDKEYFICDLVMAGEAMNVALNILLPFLKADRAAWTGKVVIGSVEGDVHDLGKNIVISMLRSAGFEVIDLGVDVAAVMFASKAKEHEANIVAASAYISSTMPRLKDVHEALVKAGVRDKVRYMVGGAAVTEEYAKKIGADGYGKDAAEAVRVAGRLMKAKGG